jgi:hypothetical protein
MKIELILVLRGRISTLDSIFLCHGYRGKLSSILLPTKYINKLSWTTISRLVY